MTISQYLVEQGGDLKENSNHGWTLLHYAAWGGSIDTIKYSVEQRRDINAKNNEGTSVIEITEKYPEIVKYLIDKGASPEEESEIPTAVIDAALVKVTTEMQDYKFIRVTSAKHLGANVWNVWVDLQHPGQKKINQGISV